MPLFPSQRVARGWYVAVLLVAMSGVAACSPTLNWRSWRPEGTRLTATMPCKPSVYARSLPLAGVPATLHLHACTADAATWAVAYAELADPARVDAALRSLLAAAGANVGVATPAAIPWAPPGATPAAAAGRASIDGRLPDGTAISLHVGVFAFGTQVFQASAIGRGIDSEALDSFFTALRLQP